MIRFFPTALVVLSVAAFTGWQASATTCIKSNPSGCETTTDLTVIDDSSGICLNGFSRIRIDSSAECVSGQEAGPATAVRCGATSLAFAYSGDGITHVLYPAGGTVWEDVLGNCGNLGYSVVSLP